MGHASARIARHARATSRPRAFVPLAKKRSGDIGTSGSKKRDKARGGSKKGDRSSGDAFISASVSGGTRGDGTGAATALTPASVAGVEEDHRFEQFFYCEKTVKRITDSFVSLYERPLFLCNPSLAVAARDRDVRDYLLLDRDDRWSEVLPKGKYKRFELSQPRLVGASFDYDAVFCDPPFANVDLAKLRAVVDLLACTESQKKAPLYLAFLGDREDEVFRHFNPAYDLERKPPALGYVSVKAETQARIFLYGPKWRERRGVRAHRETRRDLNTRMARATRENRRSESYRSLDVNRVLIRVSTRSSLVHSRAFSDTRPRARRILNH